MRQRPQTNENFWMVILAISFSIAWILTIPRYTRPLKGDSYTVRGLQIGSRLIEDFQKSRGRLPANLNEVRVFGKNNLWTRFIPYDGYGNRFLYEAVSSQYYVLKSFGSDALENTALAVEDPTATNIPPSPPSPPVYQPPAKPSLRFYPSALLMGTKSPKSAFVARLFIDFPNRKKHLVVRHLKKKQFTLTSQHDRVDEFLWLPNGYQIIYTASGMDRYQDGIYLWNIVTNEVVNIMSLVQKSFILARNYNPDRYLMSLSFIDAVTQNVYAFIAPNTGEAVSPRDFFSSKNLFAIKISEKFKRGVTVQPAQIDDNIFREVQPLAQDILIPFVGTRAQSQWVRLPLAGHPQEVIEQWQAYSVENPETPMFPYSLWWLSSIYSDAYHLLKKNQPTDAQTLRAYGSELSQALTRLTTAPPYLRATAAYIQRSLAAKQPLNYHVSQMSLH